VNVAGETIRVGPKVLKDLFEEEHQQQQGELVGGGGCSVGGIRLPELWLCDLHRQIISVSVYRVRKCHIYFKR
jgi:hypothetical protein